MINYGKASFKKNISAKHRVHDNSFNQSKLKNNKTYEKEEKIATNFERSNYEDVKNKAYLDKNLSKTEGHSSLSEKNYDEFRLHSNRKRPRRTQLKELLNQLNKYFIKRDFFDKYDFADEVLKDDRLIARHIPNLEKLNDGVIQ